MAITRIGRVERGEKVIVKVLSEPLQEEFDRLYTLKNQYRDVQDEIRDFFEDAGIKGKEIPKELHKKIFLAECDYGIAKRMFWKHINEAYNVYHIACGIRDGYCLVQSREVTLDSFDSLMNDFFRGFGPKGGRHV